MQQAQLQNESLLKDKELKLIHWENKVCAIIVQGKEKALTLQGQQHFAVDFILAELFFRRVSFVSYLKVSLSII